ncbi:hypothetical protein [Cellulomonas sp. Root137]|nr:hypothetical protein [Cellulomonas sp. Root137]
MDGTQQHTIPGVALGVGHDVQMCGTVGPPNGPRRTPRLPGEGPGKMA